MRTSRLLLGTVTALALLGASCSSSTSPSRPATGSRQPTVLASAAAVPPVRHVFVVNLENEGYASTFGAGSQAPYLSRTLAAQGALLRNYYGTAHHSLGNYIAQISGQGPNPVTQGDCGTYTAFRLTGWAKPGQAVGQGCVYPRSVRTVADQLVANGYTWRGYMEDMGTGCRHPSLGAQDTTEHARPGDQYAAKHNPFVYFRSITAQASCASRDVGLGHLVDDLKKVSTTRNLSYITPNLCNDGHDGPCVDGRPGGLATANTWLRRWVPKILASPAFRKDGLLVVTVDEADSGDASACCGEGSAPNTSSPGITGPGGGRIGAVVVSRFVSPGTRVDTTYNHYSLLRSVEDWFGLPHLGYAQWARPFGADVFGR